MTDTTTAAPADEPSSRSMRGKNAPRLRDGVMKRGRTWSYVIRVKDPETGVSKPRWVGGFATEAVAKAARDEARVNARRASTSIVTRSPSPRTSINGLKLTRSWSSPRRCRTTVT